MGIDVFACRVSLASCYSLQGHSFHNASRMNSYRDPARLPESTMNHSLGVVNCSYCVVAVPISHADSRPEPLSIEARTWRAVANQRGVFQPWPVHLPKADDDETSHRARPLANVARRLTCSFLLLLVRKLQRGPAVSLLLARRTKAQLERTTPRVKGPKCLLRLESCRHQHQRLLGGPAK